METAAAEDRIYRFGDFEADVGRRILRTLAGEPVSVTPRAFDLLAVFLRRPQVLIEKNELISILWPATVVEENNLEHTVFVLRQALGERRGQHRYIKTIHRRGYQFTASVSLATAELKPSEGGTDLPSSPRRPHGLFRVLSLFLVVLIVGAALTTWRLSHPGPGTTGKSSLAPDSRGNLAVLWFDAAPDDESQLLAESVTRLLTDRLAAVKALPVISPDSVITLRKRHAETQEAAQKLGARYLLSGETSRTGRILHLSARLLDTTAKTPLWTKNFDTPVAELAAIRERLAQAVVESIRVDPAVYHEAARAPVDLEVYELFRRAERYIGASASAADTEKAAALFVRTTTLDPGFARGYLGYAEALLYDNDINRALGPQERQTNIAQATFALDRALAIDPSLGRGWVQRARLTEDVNKADAIFRRGLSLAPNDGVNAMFYSEFLASHGRTGEALAIVQQSRKLDPLSPLLSVLEAEALMNARSDVAGSERLLHETQAMDPDFPVASGLATLHWRWTGEFAQAAKVLEQEIKTGKAGHALPAAVYLDLDDLPAAMEVWRGSDAPTAPFFMIEQYQGHLTAAAARARVALADNRVAMFGYAAEAIRDDALLRHELRPALDLLKTIFVQHAWAAGGASDYYEFATVYAHMLTLSGDAIHGQQLAKQFLLKIDADEIGRPAHWFSRHRAGLLMLLGDRRRAVEELAASQALNQWSHWWYTARRDPIFQPLHGDPRFERLVDAASRHRASERALLEEMRRRGEVPTRGAPSARASGVPRLAAVQVLCAFRPDAVREVPSVSRREPS